MQQREENKRKTEFCVFVFFYFLFSVGLEEDSYQIAGTFFPRGRADENRKRSCTTTNQAINQRAVYYIIIIMGFLIHIFL